MRQSGITDFDEPDHIYVTGRRWLFNHNHQNNLLIHENLNPINKSQHNVSLKNNHNHNNISYDKESILIGHIDSLKHFNDNQMKVENGKSQCRINNTYGSSQFTSLLLEFFNIDDTLEFYELLIQYSIKQSNCLSVPELKIMLKNQIHFYLNNDIISLSNNSQQQFNWLNKYRYTKPKNNILSNSTINYPKNRKISIFIGTWNVNGRNGSNLNLDDWLIPPEGQPPADMYVLGLQELDLRLKVITLNKTSSSGPEDLWIQQIEEALGGLLKPPSSKCNVVCQNETESTKSFAAHWFQYTGGGYILIRRVRLAGIMMIVYISAKLSIHLRHDEISQHIVPTGVLNVMGNKGGVCLRLTIFNTSLCFVNCHLAAGKEKIDRRYQDFKEIVRKMSLLFPINPKRFPFPTKKSYFSIHDVIFVFGDLNYRITGLDSDNVRRLIRQNHYVSLLKNDEFVKCTQYTPVTPRRNEILAFTA
uniref:Type II inositol 1,4,5-trisphosphate 5-phosphatase n=1 Tax=Schistosoma haematobium TaxID=6185 RepID=A0A094ZG43_SCHHA